MDLPKLEAYQKRIIEEDKGVIEWPGGSLTVFDHFYRVEVLDRLWRGPSVTFSPSSQGYDPVSWWQMLSFLTDLGPIYCIWFLEAARDASAWTPAYFATFWVSAAQLLGIGSVAPIYYFLWVAFGPPIADLIKPGKRAFQCWYFAFLLPLVLVFHNFEVFTAYLSPDPTTRHYWIWAWQMSPLWIGIANFASSYIILNRYYVSMFGRISVLLKVVCTVSAIVWVSVLLISPYSIFDLFSSCFLCLVYQFVEMYHLGFIELDGFWPLALLPVALACFGPGVTFVLGWWWRERKLYLASERRGVTDF
ncbi:hypothetical protein MMYC01_204483 [Madurella mycetomatis]|uniref:Uncharacterized protein n=1 Tax=Madurella mycetomatis TaxID=100816 RepID=A0A175W986_9PEZI|nr:hypothetical protein MMYC01_205300 [Madurella mycetomatis]KXX79564.1 hypothetical protein MMYC01_204483 [Madurella mycetomatis]